MSSNLRIFSDTENMNPLRILICMPLSMDNHILVHSVPTTLVHNRTLDVY